MDTIETRNAGPAGHRTAGVPPLRPGKPAAAAAVWVWRPSESARSAAGARMRREGVVRALIGAAAGTLVFLFWHQPLAYVVWGIAAVTLLAALLSPARAYRWIQKGVGFVVLAVGGFLTWTLLSLFFFLFVCTFGLLARRGRNDRMERRFEGSLPSYWKVRNDPPRDAAFFKRQF